MKTRDDFDSDDKKLVHKKKGKQSGIALAIWIVIALVLFVFFLVEQDKIVSNLKDTNFFQRVFGKTPAFVENHEDTVKPDEDKNDVAPIDINVLKGDNASSDTGVVSQNNAATVQKQQTATSTKNESAPEPSKPTTTVKPVKPSETTKPSVGDKPKPITSTPAQMNVKLCFMNIGSDGSVNRKEITRTMKKTESPLVDTINALIAGPNGDEQDKGCRSLIPAGSKLLTASVKNGVATLNFNADFEFNQYGVEGTLGQLQQIVYTATAFPTVESVQFLVEGELKEYLGSEGVWIGSPLGRNNFK